jgi:hypothetical protein
MKGMPHLTKETGELLRSAGSAVPERTRFCPDDASIAEYFEGLGDEREADGLTHHLSGCGYCQHRIGMMARIDGEADKTELPEHLVAMAKQMVGRNLQPGSTSVTAPRDTRQLSGVGRRVPMWATAAVMVLVLTIVLERPELSSPEAIGAPDQDIPDSRPDTDQPMRQLRSVSNEVQGPRVLSPERGRMVDPSSLTVRWTTVEGTLYYDFYLLSDAGDLLVKERLTATQWSSGQPFELKPGAEYFIRVDSFLPDGNTVSSEHVDFKVGGGG